MVEDSAERAAGGPEPVIKTLVAQFEKKYPNVKVNLTFKGFTDYMKVIQLSLNGNNAPDVSEGNQSYATDALLVKAKLIVWPAPQRQRQIGAVAEGVAQPPQAQRAVLVGDIGHEHREQPRAIGDEIRPAKIALALAGAGLAER